MTPAQDGGAAFPQIDDAAVFFQWWQRRNLPDDKAVLAAAIKAGSVTKSGGLLWLTDRGKLLKREGIRLRHEAVLAARSAAP